MTTKAEDETLRILSKVCEVPLETLTPEARLIQDLDIDSVVTLDLLSAIEDSFDIEIPEIEATQLVTVGDVLAYVRKNVEAA